MTDRIATAPRRIARFYLCLLAALLAFPTVAQACIKGPTHQFLFAGTATEAPAPLILIEGAVVSKDDDELTLKLTKSVKGIPAGTVVTIPHTGSPCRNEWGASDGAMVQAIGAFRSFRMPHPVFEAVPLKRPDLPHSDWRKYIVDPDYVRMLEEAAKHD